MFLVCAAVACSGGRVTGRDARISHPQVPDEAILEVTASGGIPPPEVRVSDTLPRVWLAGDGRYLAPSSTAETSTPALVAVEERHLTEAAIQSLLRDAQQAGLLEPDAEYGKPEVFDAVNTRIAIVAGGRRHDVIVRALGYPVSDLDEATVTARAEVARFLDDLEHPASLSGVGEPRPYSPTEIAVFVLGPATSDVLPAIWPLGDLDTLGTLTRWPTETARCFVISGTDAATLLPIAAQTPRSTPWQSANARWQIVLRPLLPDEHTCADVVP